MAVAALKDEGHEPRRDSSPPQHNSSVRPRAVANLRFEDGPEDSLTAVEFEAPPQPSILYAICSALSAQQVAIVDSATRITPRALFQRFQLREQDGRQLVGQRRREIERLFIEQLAGLA